MFMRERLAQEGEVLKGVVVSIPSPISVQAIAAAGADFLMIDREHSPIGRETVATMIAATAGTSCAPLVRVASIDASEVKVALDSGAEGIVVPMVRTAEEAARSVELMRYPPGGTRGWGPFVAAARFGVSPADYSQAIGPHLSCWLQIETLDAVEAIEEIVRVPGIDALMVAPFDLSIALGIEAQFDDARFVEAVDAVERAAAAAGLPLVGAAFDPARAAELTARGYRALLRGVDLLMLQAAVASF
jgi:4-hydroxy-2-oxoheptanedioate aldolase